MKHIQGRLQITRDCNQDCVFCAAPPTKEQLTPKELDYKFKELKELGVTEIMLTGGEPLIRDDFLDILKRCNEFQEITIQTNATLLDWNMVRDIRKINKNTRFNVSLDTCDKAVFGKITGKPENFPLLVRALKLIGDFSMWAYPTVVISNLNYRELSDLIRFINKNFYYMNHISFNYIDPTNKAKDNPWTIPKYCETEKYMHEAVTLMKDFGMSFRIERVPLCYMSGFEEFSSDIRRDVFDENRIISFLRTDKDDDKERLFIEKGSRFVYAEQCRSCKINMLCPGINPNYVSVHGSTEVFPMFSGPEDIVKRVQCSKQPSKIDNFVRKVQDDLMHFRKAIDMKSTELNTNNQFLLERINAVDEVIPHYDRVKFIVKEFYQRQHVRRKEYYSIFKTELVDDFPYAVKALESLEIVSIQDDMMVFADLSEAVLYPYMMFFIGREYV